MVLALSNVNPEEAQKVAQELMEEIAPYLKAERADKEDKMKKALAGEMGIAYKVSSAEKGTNKRNFKLSKRRTRRGATKRRRRQNVKYSQR